jgi:uncharacterized membrane protein
MRIVALYYAVTMGLVATIVAVAVMWCHFNHIRVGEGRLLFRLWGTHGVHVFDVWVLVIEFVLLTLLSAILLAGFSRQPSPKLHNKSPTC